MALRLTLNGINRRGRDRCVKFWLMQGLRVRIYSREHRAWWRPDAAGYTTDQSCAGIYRFEDAYNRTFHCGPEKRIEYHACETQVSA